MLWGRAAHDPPTANAHVAPGASKKRRPEGRLVYGGRGRRAQGLGPGLAPMVAHGVLPRDIIEGNLLGLLASWGQVLEASPGAW